MLALTKAKFRDRLVIQSPGKKAMITAKIIGIQTKELSMVNDFG